MANQLRARIIAGNPIGAGLDTFRASFASICADKSITCLPDSLGQLSPEDIQNLVLDLLSALQSLRTSRLLPSSNRGKNLFSDLTTLSAAANSDDFDLDRTKPLLRTALSESLVDTHVWDQVYIAVAESTPAPRLVASSLQQTPWIRNTSSFVNSSEHRKYMDDVLKEELGSMYVGLHEFQERYFEDVLKLEPASEAFLEQCKENSNPIFDTKWKGWPEDANQDDVLNWFANFCEKLSEFAGSYDLTRTYQRRPLAKPNEPIDGSTAKRKMDIGFARNPDANTTSRCHWSQILVPGELKSNLSADKPSEAWLDLGRYAREVLAAQDNRRYVLGFTICGSAMRLWEFDRLGGIASDQFDVHKDALRFIRAILGFLWMSEEHLGFDPTIVTVGDKRYLEIMRDGIQERLVIDRVMRRAPCIAGRATTCWKAHREGEARTPLVIKDSWQYTEREEEGELLQNATDKGVVSIARYYHHETVQVAGKDDDIQLNVRKGLDISKAENYRPGRLTMPLSTAVAGASRKCHSTMDRKRSSSQTNASLPPNKRSRSASPAKKDIRMPVNRVHRRVIVRDYGKPIYQASSRTALLAALEGCVQGHESLLDAGFLHRDISVNNLVINEDDSNPSLASFLIDFDLAIEETRTGASGAQGKTGTRAFMAIGALLGEQHSFMHDLESFFWVLLWICIHYPGPDKSRVVRRFDKWNYMETEELAVSKLGTIGDESIFLKVAEENFTTYYQPLIPWVNRLRKEVFPNNERSKMDDKKLYTRIQHILREAQKEVDV
ncbi:hypothetical protein BKA67DRAFT_525584 [Truncatella angustata]|uniref:non-specific serine/threonine protein kinase n=1 Tax=Truncatella angustata TaxID=152316 RepID=A0A9P8RJ56_9PEZI|nr:uncharacterized protein BKA67DRAFT_525584 [Truncatella angustata]KAH6646842.1 hypothetical protein BKA67DRAFT_525584 [Truncatella angustata]